MASALHSLPIESRPASPARQSPVDSARQLTRPSDSRSAACNDSIEVPLARTLGGRASPGVDA
jgi:hypothetical protein